MCVVCCVLCVVCVVCVCCVCVLWAYVVCACVCVSSLGGNLNGHLYRFGEAISHMLVHGLNALDIHIGNYLHESRDSICNTCTVKEVNCAVSKVVRVVQLQPALHN